MYLSAVSSRGQRRSRRLGQLPGFDIVGPLAVGIATAPPPAPGTISNADLALNWLDSFGGMAYGCYPWDVACANKAAMITAGQAQIQQVPTNAAYYYGADSAAAQVAQQFATQQETLVPSDVSGAIAATAVGPGGIPVWLIAVGAIAGGLLLISVLK